uniref:Putative 17.2 kDa salivary protein n=1 Tax=Culex tarsalis TaxID=7177 RepID=A0A1Q3EV31_CULTA
MKAILVAGQILILVSVAQANNPWGGSGVCVTFYSVGSDEQLVSSYRTHDRDRRHVGLVRNQGNNWVITKDEKYPDHYKIRHKENGQELFESQQNYKGNYIFTWIPKTVINDGGASWNIMWVSDGVYVLKNKKFQHCLWSAGGKISAYDGCDHKQYHWKIWKIAC